jgi:putative flippase GtrA
MFSFGLIGLSGIAVNTATLWVLYDVLGLHHLLGAALATQASTAWNFVLTDSLVYRRQRHGARSGRAARFFVMNNLLLLARLPFLQILVSAGVDVLVANVVTLVALFLVRFLLSDRVIYQRREQNGRDPVRLLVEHDIAAPVPAVSSKRSNYLTYRYDVAGTVTIGSQILLPELEFFRAQWVDDDDVDITIRVGAVGGRGPRRRAAMTEYANPTTMRYEEHLGRLGANFRVEFGDRIDITVGPLLARSPHVVYTNIVEALLRFVLVSRGRMLLHSACVNLDGVGVMLSALTDTGKTATILRLLRDHGGRFLSDDMTVIDADGNAVCFPKPLTISAHTLRAVNATDLTPREWRHLQFQSRLHSKGGRSFALTLARWNVPIMGINAIMQILVPPPKYSVDRLVPCRMGSSTTVEELFIIERGAPAVRDLGPGTTLERMIENTEDAYGFPPFRYLAPSIKIGGQTSAELRQREREILSGFLSHVRTRVLASDCYGWADEIPRLLVVAQQTPGSAAASVVPPQRRTAPHAAEAAWPHWGGLVPAQSATQA